MSLQPEQKPKTTAAQPFLLQGSDRYGYSGTMLSVYSPLDHATIVGTCHCPESLHIELIERAAEAGFQSYRHSKPSQRAAILTQLAELLFKEQDAMAILITQESGKPIRLARQEVTRAIEICRSYAVEASRGYSALYHIEDRQARVGRFPIGPVLAVTPYNFPLNLVVHKLAPAIAAGCSITVKPSPRTPLTALFLGRLAIDAGYEAISVIPTDSHEITEALVRSESFAKFSFTGSDRVGWHLKSLAGRKDVALELGGNAALVLEDIPETEIPAVAARAAYGAFAYSGQICISIQRIIIQERLKDSFMNAFIPATRALKVGDPILPNTDLGPMISIEDVQRTRKLIKEALQAGGNVVYGGNAFNALTMNPTILDRTTPEMAVNADEVFAPIVTISSYSDFLEGLALANRSRYGLQAGIYTNDLKKAEQAYRYLDVGGVLINDIPTFRADLLPYGGVKDSGMGREGVLAGLDAYSYLKTLIISG